MGLALNFSEGAGGGGGRSLRGGRRGGGEGSRRPGHFGELRTGPRGARGRGTEPRSGGSGKPGGRAEAAAGARSSAAAGTARWASGEAGHPPGGAPAGAGEGGPGSSGRAGRGRGLGQTFATYGGCARSSGWLARGPGSQMTLSPHIPRTIHGEGKCVPEHQLAPACWLGGVGGGGPGFPPNAESGVRAVGPRPALSTEGGPPSPPPGLLASQGCSSRCHLGQRRWGGCTTLPYPPWAPTPPNLPSPGALWGCLLYLQHPQSLPGPAGSG